MNNKLDKLARKYTIEDLEGILDKIPYLVWLKDKEGKFIYVNKSGAENMGLAKDEMIGRSDYEILDYNVAKKCYETDASLMENNNDLYNEEYINIDGQDRLYRVHKYILNRGTNKENILCGMAEEISLDRKLQLKVESNLLEYLDKSKDEDDPKKYIHSTLVNLKEVIKCNNIDILLYNEDEKAFKLYISENKDKRTLVIK